MKTIKNLVLIFLFLIFGVISYSQSLTDSEILIQLKNSAHFETLKCPNIIDNEYRLDCVMAYAPKTVEYEYTVNYYIKDIDIYKAKSLLESIIFNNIRKNNDNGFSDLKDNKITFKYSYYDLDGVYLFTITASPDKYIPVY